MTTQTIETTLKPTGNRVLLRPVELKIGNLTVVREGVQDHLKMIVGQIVAVGPETTTCQVGDIVHFRSICGLQMMDRSGQVFTLLENQEILAIEVI